MGKRQLDGLVIAVTGGAAGIGRQIAEQAAWAGARVAIGDRNAEAAAATASELGAGMRSYPLDVTDEASFTTFLDDVERDLGPLDVLVNNAGVMWVGPFDAEPETATEAMFAVNVLGVIRGIRLAAPRMRERGGGHVVTIASAASKLAPPGEASYAASKHAVLGYLTGVREELRGSGVHISAILPGVVDTELAAGTASGAAKMLQPADVARAVVHTIERPRFEVPLPGYVSLLARLVDLLPQAVRDAALRRLVPNQVTATRGSSERRQYESHTVTGTEGQQ